ncbi:hypothetical protein [Corynebacterium ulcerans]|uniref:hypothetical protein n=1 Tax=Corynebacterium ulcerans TaxID=65058 RepID=UPI0018D95212|nr:hypothetical protein [Corynebacterium ulcerans]MBH5302748.1 hypothetical protein [Corynebacterium ulcerans]
MPRVKGKLSTITERPSSIREVWIRPPATRPGGVGLIVKEPARVLVDDDGEFTVDLALGSGVLSLIGLEGIGRESIPILIHEGTATIRQAVEDAKDFAPENHDRIAALAAETQKNLAEARGVRGEVSAAAQKVREATAALSTAAAQAVSTATEGIKKGASDVLASVQAAQKAAKTSEDNAAKAAVGAEGSKAQAVISASNAAASEGKAQAALEGLQAKLEAWKPNAEQLEKWQPQYQWLKENASSGFVKIAEMMQDAASGLRGELAGLVEQARTAQTTAGQHSLKAQAAAKDAETTSTRIVDAAIAKLKGNAPAMLDTLEELAERVKSGGTLEAEIIQKLSKMADSETVKNIVARLDGLTIAGVQGLSAALADKAAARHKHGTSDISGLDQEIAGLKDDLNERAPRRHGHAQSDISGLAETLSNLAGELRNKLGASDFPTMLSRDSTFSSMQSKVTSVERRISTAESSVSGVENSLSSVRQDLTQKANRSELANMVTGSSGITKIEVVASKPYSPLYGVLYLVKE